MKKINDVVVELNRKGGEWVAIDGVRAMTQVSKENGSFSFNPASGLLVKAFMDQQTNEIKLFPALMFEDSF